MLRLGILGIGAEVNPTLTGRRRRRRRRRNGNRNGDSGFFTPSPIFVNPRIQGA
jgi:hypothetical protein